LIRLGRTFNIGTKERLAALLCVMLVAAGAIFGLMYLIDFDFLPFR
jgi:hypothetical protein